MIGKEPSDRQLWWLDGELPTFVKMEEAAYGRVPIWTMVLKPSMAIRTYLKFNRV